jgi:hypothetical protein
MATHLASPAGFRSLADQLRGWPEVDLARLLVERPDLAHPAPQDSAQLASRAATRSSIMRALDQLTRVELATLDALVLTGPTILARLQGVVHAEPPSVAAALDRLRALALAWDSTAGVRALTGVGDGLTGTIEHGVSGLRAFSDPAPDPDAVTVALAEVSEQARILLEHVVDQGGEAATGTARVTVAPQDAATPAEELLARRLLVPRGRTHALAPGEVGVALRGGHTTTTRVDEIPDLATGAREATHVDRAAAGAAFEACRRAEAILDRWSAAPPTALRSGGLGVRDLKATANALHLEESEAALLIETVAAAGLVTTVADQHGNPVWLPTDLFDTWAQRPTAQRWTLLAATWLTSPRMPGLVGTRDSAGKAWNALAPELAAMHMAETRRMTLEVVADLEPGTVLAPGTGVPSVVARLAWSRPRRPRLRGEQVVWTLREAAFLGVTGLDGMASFARPLLGGDESAAATALAGLLPQPLDHVLIQADLTAVAPGPLESALARKLQLVADVESGGAASVYRFSSDSVRRALDVGWTATEVHEFLAAVSRTPVPQPLTYLVDDTARRFGTVRVGYAEAYLRADDETALAELLHHPQARALGLRRLAPTVLISTAPIDVLLPRLREMGAAPVVEAEDGTVHIARADVRRARTPKEHRATGAVAARRTAGVSAVVTAIRAGDRAASSRPASPQAPTNPSTALADLRDAVESGTTVVISYVDNHGTRTDRVVDPIAVEGGVLTARDHRSDDTRRFAVHRITAVRAVDP